MEGLETLPPMTLMLVSAIVWLSGLFVWLIKRFVDSFEKNTEVMTRVSGALDAIDRKLDTSAERDLETVKMLEKIHARQIDPPSVNVVMGDHSKSNGSS